MTRHPTPAQVRAARDDAGLSSAQAAALVHTTARVFQQWAAGDRRMHPALWELLHIKMSRLLSGENDSEWHPIDTAPRDGTWVRLCGGTCVDDEGAPTSRQVVGQWTRYRNTELLAKGRWQFAWYDGGYYGEYSAPTHWAPCRAC